MTVRGSNHFPLSGPVNDTRVPFRVMCPRYCIYSCLGQSSSVPSDVVRRHRSYWWAASEGLASGRLHFIGYPALSRKATIRFVHFVKHQLDSLCDTYKQTGYNRLPSLHESSAWKKEKSKMNSFLLDFNSLPTSAVLSFALLTFLVYISGYVLYQRYFHPLSGYPGPFLASITDLWQAYQFMKLKQPYHLTDLHAKYGSFVRYGPDKLSITAEDAVPIIYQKGGKTMPKTEFYDAYGAAHPNVFGMRDEAVSVPPLFLLQRLAK